MPFYDYQCDECGLPLSTRRSVEGRDTVECPQCELPMRRLLARVQIQTPAHFQMPRGWHQPQTKEGWRRLEENQAKLVTEKPETFGEHVEKTLAKERRITLAGQSR